LLINDIEFFVSLSSLLPRLLPTTSYSYKLPITKR